MFDGSVTVRSVFTLILCCTLRLLFACNARRVRPDFVRPSEGTLKTCITSTGTGAVTGAFTGAVTGAVCAQIVRTGVGEVPCVCARSAKATLRGLRAYECMSVWSKSMYAALFAIGNYACIRSHSITPRLFVVTGRSLGVVLMSV